jgi:hypothetical protein
MGFFSKILEWFRDDEVLSPPVAPMYTEVYTEVVMTPVEEKECCGGKDHDCATYHGKIEQSKPATTPKKPRGKPPKV